MGSRLRPFFSENFADNLDQIRRFLETTNSLVFDRMMDRLFDDIVPLLCQFPRSGRDFLSVGTASLEALASWKRLQKVLKKGDELREFVFDEYILLYLVRQKLLICLAIKHHRQLSFVSGDFGIKILLETHPETRKSQVFGL